MQSAVSVKADVAYEHAEIVSLCAGQLIHKPI